MITRQTTKKASNVYTGVVFKLVCGPGCQANVDHFMTINRISKRIYQSAQANYWPVKQFFQGEHSIIGQVP